MSREQFEGRRVLVVGLGRSGIAAAGKLVGLGADVLCSDCSVSIAHAAEVERLIAAGVEIKLGEQVVGDLEGRDLVVVSPGVPTDIPILSEARQRGVAVWSEIELAFRLTDRPIIAVTGTNGKTTTVSMIGHILEGAGRPHRVAGNIGFPLIAAVDQAGPEDLIVAEVSSFQLENIESFAPRVGVLLNISEDHFDRHRTLAVYQEVKGRLFEYQSEEDVAVINRDDEHCWELVSRVKAQVVPFSRQRAVKNGVGLKGGRITGPAGETIIAAEALKMRGAHNVQNAMAAAATCLAIDVPAPKIGAALASFAGLDHRLEHVSTVGGVDFYNDSKATNPDATARAIESFAAPVILLAGGRNKGMDMAALAPLSQSLKAALLFGESASDIEQVLAKSTTVERAESLEDAVRRSYELAQPGDVVLLSPACASFDMFKDYEERGTVFKNAVAQLAGKR